MKQIKRIAKVELIGGGARPGPALVSLGINMPLFCREFNDQTQQRKGEVVPVAITVYIDKTFSFLLKTTPTAVLLKQAVGIEKAASNSKSEQAGTISPAALTKIAQQKLPDLNTKSLAMAKKIIMGTARQMGISVADAE